MSEARRVRTKPRPRLRSNALEIRLSNTFASPVVSRVHIWELRLLLPGSIDNVLWPRYDPLTDWRKPYPRYLHQPVLSRRVVSNGRIPSETRVSEDGVSFMAIKSNVRLLFRPVLLSLRSFGRRGRHL